MEVLPGIPMIYLEVLLWIPMQVRLREGFRVDVPVAGTLRFSATSSGLRVPGSTFRV